MKYLFLLILLSSSIGRAYDLGMKYGLGFGLPNQNDISEVKFIAIEIQNDLGRLFKHKLGVGTWFDPKPDLNRTSAAFGSYSIGLRVEPGLFYIENFFGLSLISQTDGMLSTNFEFTEELGFGIKDSLGRYIGFEYRHFSNAGLQLPNKGRDFLLINVGVEL